MRSGVFRIPAAELHCELTRGVAAFLVRHRLHASQENIGEIGKTGRIGLGRSRNWLWVRPFRAVKLSAGAELRGMDAP